MSGHQAVREFIREIVLGIRDDITFYYCRESTFNTITPKKYPSALLLPLTHEVDRVNYTNHRVYKATIIFYVPDSMQGDEVESQASLDRADDYLGKFQAKLNLRVLGEDPELMLSADTIELSNENVEPRIKQTADNCTGWEYSFSLLVPDQFSYCKIYD